MKTFQNQADIDWFLSQRELEETNNTDSPFYGIRCKSCRYWKQYINKPEYGECTYFKILNDNLPNIKHKFTFKIPKYCLNCHQNGGCEVWDGTWVK